MKITKKSKKLMSLFIDNECINYSTFSSKTKSILLPLYDDLKNADEYIKSIQREKTEGSFYKLSIKKIATISQIPMPSLFNANNFPLEIRKQIENFSVYHLSYSFSLFQREIGIHFVVEDTQVELFPEKYNAYVDKILVWLTLINQYSSKKCSKRLSLFIYMTSLEKNLPTSNVTVLDQIHVNTAFTHTCPVNSEIVVFREEEWFKVLMHETFHNFALDFSDMNTHPVNQKILSIFKVDSEVNLFEAYTEFWAEIWNAMFCSFYLKENKRLDLEVQREHFLKNCEFFINFERTYGFFQLVKTLKFMGLQYADLYSANKKSQMLRNTLYKEKSNILAYYVIRMVLLNNYQGFLSWCHSNNVKDSSLVSFKKTSTNLEKMYTFIESNYKSSSMMNGVRCMEHLLASLYVEHEKRGKNKKKDRDFLLNNMRMTVCEMG